MKSIKVLSEKLLVFSLDASVLCKFFNCSSDLRLLMRFMNLRKKNVNGNLMRKMKFRLVHTTSMCLLGDSKKHFRSSGIWGRVTVLYNQ